MSLDDDFHRDPAAAFGPASLVEGGILPYEGRRRVRRPEGLWSDALRADEDGWLSPNNPVLVRGQLRILPLAWRPEPAGSRAAGVTSEEIDEFAAQMEDSGYYWSRSGRTLEESLEQNGATYAAALRAAGATKATFWTVSESVAVALVRTADEDAGADSLALHVVPAGWVADSPAGPSARRIDVRWSWQDVVDLYT